MFPGSLELELEARFLRSGRIFCSGKTRKTIGGRRNPSLFEENEYKVKLRLGEGSCDEEEEYSPISEGQE